MTRRTLLLVAFLAGAGLTGCGEPGRKEERVAVPQVDSLKQVRALLQRYADGQPMTSEASSFPGMIAEVRKTDPAKADLLQKGFEDMQKNPASLRAKAKELLGKL